MSRGWVPVFSGLCAVVLLNYTAFGAAMPVLPRLVEHRLHGPDLAVGAAFAISAIAALLSRPYVGRLAQRAGGRTVMAAGACGAALVGLLYAADTALGGATGVTGLLVTRAFMGVCEAAVFTSGSLWVVALAPEERRGQIVGLYGLAMWSGWTLGPIAGEELRVHTGYGGVWIAHVVLPLIGALIVTRLPSERGAEPTRRLMPRPVVLPGVSLALAAVGYSALSGFAVLLLDARGVGGGPLVLSLFGASYVVVRLAAGRLPDRAGAGRVAVVCGLTEAAGLVLIAMAHTLWAAAAGALVMGAGFTLLYPSLALLVINRTPPEERGAALGAYTSFWDLGLGAGGLLTGAVASFGYPVIFMVAAGAAVAAAAAGRLAGAARPPVG